MQNNIKSILFTTLLLSTAITSLNAMDPAWASSASHQQAQQEAQLPPISYDDFMAFVLAGLYSVKLNGEEIATQSHFISEGLQGNLIDLSQKVPALYMYNQQTVKEKFKVQPITGLVRLNPGQEHNGYTAEGREWVQLYHINFQNPFTDSVSDENERLQALPNIDGFMALSFPNTDQDFSPQALAEEPLRLTGQNVPLPLPSGSKKDDSRIHPFEGELGLNTFSGFLKTFFVKNGNAFPELRVEDKKSLRDGSDVILKLGNSVGEGIPNNLFVRLRGTTAFQNSYDIHNLLQNPEYHMPGDDPEVQWDEARKQYYVDIPGFGNRGYAERAGQTIGWPAFRQYITVDVKASPSFDMFMKARKLAKQVMSPSMDLILKKPTTNENRESLRKTLTPLLNDIKSVKLNELEKTYGRYDIFEWLKQRKEAIAMRLEALGPVPAEPQAQQQPPRQEPQAGPAPQTQPQQQGASDTMPDIKNNYPGMTVIEDVSGLWQAKPAQITDEYKNARYQNAQVLELNGNMNSGVYYSHSIIFPEKTEVFKVKLFTSSLWQSFICSLFGSLGNSNGEINNPNLKVLDIHALSTLNDMRWVAQFMNEPEQIQYFRNRKTPFIIYNHPSFKNSPENEQVLYFDPSTKKFSLMSVTTYMTQYRNTMSGTTPPQSGPSQEQARSERERYDQEQARRAQEQARQARERAERERYAQEQARRAQDQARAERERYAQEQARRAQEQARQARERAEQQARAEQARANADPAPAQQVNLDEALNKLSPYLRDDMRNFTIKGIKNSLALKLDRTSFNDTAVAQFGGADGLLIKDDVWAIIAQLPLKSLTIDQSIQLPNVQEQYYTSVNSIYPPIYEVPQAILQMKTLENLTINRNDNVLFPDISGLPKLKILKIGSSYEDTSIYLLKKNVDIFMTRSTMNKDLNFLTIKGPIHGIKIFGLKNRDDFYALASFKQRYGHNTFGIFQIVGFE